MKFGIVGCGGIGTLHAELIAAMPERASLVAVADAIPAAAKALGERYDAPAGSGVGDLCADPAVEAISVCLPNGQHADAAVAALRAGKHVVVEKPIDVTLAAADRIIAAEQAGDRTVTVISQRRFQPAFAAVHAAAAAGRFGRLTYGSVHTTFWRPQEYYDSADWRGTWAGEGGGALINQGSHGLDLLVWMLGEPVTVSAVAANLAHERIEVEDTLTATIRFADGAVGTFAATTAEYPGGTVRLEIGGDAGRAVVEHETLQYLHTRDAEPLGTAEAAEDTADQSAGAGADGDSSVDAAHAAQYRDFVDAVATGRQPLIGTADGRRTPAVMLAAYESARHGGTPIEVAR